MMDAHGDAEHTIGDFDMDESDRESNELLEGFLDVPEELPNFQEKVGDAEEIPEPQLSFPWVRFMDTQRVRLRFNFKPLK